MFITDFDFEAVAVNNTGKQDKQSWAWLRAWMVSTFDGEFLKEEKQFVS